MGASTPRQRLRAVPRQIRALDGQTVDTSGDSWAFQASADGGQLLVLSWAALRAPPVFAVGAIHCVKLYLADRLTRKKPRAVANDFGMFQRFGRWLASQKQRPFDWGHLTEGLARGFLAHGMNTRPRGNHFSRLRTFYTGPVAHDVEAFTASLLRRLS